MIQGRLLALFLVLVTALRWLWQYVRPLSPEESYLALCGFIPSLAYFDGPGGTPLLVALGISVAGPGGLGATFFWPVLAALASVFLYLLVTRLTGPSEGLAIAVVINLLPVFKLHQNIENGLSFVNFTECDGRVEELNFCDLPLLIENILQEFF